MSGITGAVGPTDYGMMSSLVANAASVKQKLNQLTNQVSTGLVGNTYAGLGSGAPVSLDLRPQIASMQTWQNNVDAATGRMSVAQTALTAIQSIASNFYAQLNNVQGVNSSEIDSVAANARDALGQVADLLDAQDGGVYVFAGQDTGNPPVPDPDNILTSGYFTQISTAVAGLAVNGAAATANATYAVATSNAPDDSPFSPFLSQPAATVRAALPVVQIGQNQTETVGLPASANGMIPDSPLGTPTIAGGPPVSTGSYMRDVLRALATIGSLSSSQAGTGRLTISCRTRGSVCPARLLPWRRTLACWQRQSSLTATQTQLSDTQTALTGQVSPAEDVDMAATMSQLSLVQTQMQASYQLIATLNGLSLAKFLPAS